MSGGGRRGALDDGDRPLVDSRRGHHAAAVVDHFFQDWVYRLLRLSIREIPADTRATG